MNPFTLGTKAQAEHYRLAGFEEVDSTNKVALDAFKGGDKGKIWFAALGQSAGRGRRGRAWQSPPGNLAASLLLPMTQDAETTASLGFVAGVALHDALVALVPRLETGLALKWPNDLLLHDAKLSGTLLEAHQHQDRHGLVIGIGVNIVAAPSGLPYRATCLAEHGVGVGAVELFSALSDAWTEAHATWDEGRGLPAILARWRTNAAGIGSEITVRRPTDELCGTFESVDETGRLILLAKDRTRIAVSAGDVHFGAAASVPPSA